MIWEKLVKKHIEWLEALREGLGHLRMYQDLQELSGKDLQLLFHGNDFVQVEDIVKVVVFSSDTWANRNTFD